MPLLSAPATTSPWPSAPFASASLIIFFAAVIFWPISASVIEKSPSPSQANKDWARAIASAAFNIASFLSGSSRYSLADAISLSISASFCGNESWLAVSSVISVVNGLIESSGTIFCVGVPISNIGIGKTKTLAGIKAKAPVFLVKRL